ncbi:MAG: phosphoglucosamine mutase [Bacteroidales bacterium]|nr:phosphoglucosamine mutase [Bacteroidales bacterium]
MTLIKSISGIRGTIGGKANEGLTPLDIVKFTAAFSTFIKNRAKNKNIKIVVGRDARISGNMVNNIIVNTLVAMGIDVIDTGLSTTPTVEIAVCDSKADAGIIITASHNPMHWNALKLLNNNGEFVSDKEGKEIINIADNENFEFADVQKLGKIITDNSYIDKHIDKILKLSLVDTEAIKKKKFKIAFDGVNSTGGIAIPKLLKALGVETVYTINCEPTGIFSHNPEPIPANLVEISDTVKEKKADLGFVVDPDVDRLAIICENGEMFGEEYTLVAVSDYILKNKKGNTVSNLSSTKALKDVTEKYGGNYFASAVGEVNVVEMMKKQNAIIGGEGNGGVIYPELHYGRDALVGIALFLSHLALSDKKCSELRKTLPDYFIFKSKLKINSNINIDAIINSIKEEYKNFKINTIDGIKIEFDNEWAHIRKSNTEPILRIYTESETSEKAEILSKKIIDKINTILKNS